MGKRAKTKRIQAANSEKEKLEQQLITIQKKEKGIQKKAKKLVWEIDFSLRIVYKIAVEDTSRCFYNCP